MPCADDKHTMSCVCHSGNDWKNREFVILWEFVIVALVWSPVAAQSNGFESVETNRP